MDIEVNGKKIVLRDEFKGAIGYQALEACRARLDLYRKAQEDGDQRDYKAEYERTVDLCAATIVEWDYDGAPDDPRSYESLPAADLARIGAAVLDHAVVALFPPNP